VLPKFSFARQGPFLAADLKAAHADSSETGKVNVGDKGIAMTFLRPSGKMKINGDMIDVVSDHEFIEKGTPIVVKDIKGNRIIVSIISEDQQTSL